MVVKLTLIMKNGTYEKVRVTDADSVEEAIQFMKDMRPGVVDAVHGWDLAEQQESQDA